MVLKRASSCSCIKESSAEYVDVVSMESLLRAPLWFRFMLVVNSPVTLHHSKVHVDNIKVPPYPTTMILFKGSYRETKLGNYLRPSHVPLHPRSIGAQLPPRLVHTERFHSLYIIPLLEAVSRHFRYTMTLLKQH